MATCAACHGSGQCRTCSATGMVRGQRCPDCFGNRLCRTCGGTGHTGGRPYER